MAVEKLEAEVLAKGIDKFESDMRAADAAIGKTATTFDDTTKSADGYSDSLDEVSRETVDATDKSRQLVRAEADLSKASKNLSDAQRELARNTDPAKQRELEDAVLKAKSGMDRASIAVDKLGGETEKSNKRFKVFGLTLTDIKSGIDMVSGVITKFVAAAKKALDFAELGATALQVEESFERTRVELGLDVDMLDQLAAAVNNTIPKQELMASAQTLVAGTSKEFGAALLENLPRLASYAKASNKLNPALGDTSFLLESIATGLKRGSPMILDNLGLVVKVGDANIAYAKILGKTVDEMTAEEKQMALLNDVMRAGDRLIEQVGGSTDSLVDQFAQLRTATEDLKTEASKLWAELINVGEAAKVLNRFTTLLQYKRLIDEAEELGLVTKKQADAYRDLTRVTSLWESKDETEERMTRIAEAAVELNEALADNSLANEVAIDGWRRYQVESGKALEIIDDSAQLLDEQRMATSHAHNAMRIMGEEASDLADDMQDLADETRNTEDANIGLYKSAISAAEAEAELTRVEEEKAAALEYSNTIFGYAIEALDGYGEANRRAVLAATALKLITGEVTAEELRQQEAIAILTEDYINGKLSLDEYIGSVEGLIAGSTTAADVIANETSPSISELEVDAYLAKKEIIDLTDELGNLSKEDVKIQLDFQALTTAIGKAEYLLQKIREIGTASVNIGGYQVPDVDAAGKQMGGQVFPGEAVLVGERGPEMFMPQQGGQMIPNNVITDARQFNLTAQSVIRPGGLALEFATLEMASR